MSRYAVINSNNEVVNVIAWDGVTPYKPEVGLIMILSEVAGRGDTYNPVTGEFIKDSWD